jgi:hypothetical protein
MKFKNGQEVLFQPFRNSEWEKGTYIAKHEYSHVVVANKDKRLLFTKAIKTSTIEFGDAVMVRNNTNDEWVGPFTYRAVGEDNVYFVTSADETISVIPISVSVFLFIKKAGE